MALHSHTTASPPAQPVATLPGFRSFKCPEPVHYARRVCRDGLIQATLDASVDNIFPFEHAVDISDCILAFGLYKSGHKMLVALCERSQLAFRPPNGFALAIATPIHGLLQEPGVTTARMIWARRAVQISPLFLVRVLAFIRTRGGRVRLIDLEACAVEEGTTWVDNILAMSCHGLLTLQLGGQITDETEVSLGPTALKTARISSNFLAMTTAGTQPL